eukprot:9627398-Lingulodinium_polyedra.AAC.1
MATAAHQATACESARRSASLRLAKKQRLVMAPPRRAAQPSSETQGLRGAGALQGQRRSMMSRDCA